MPFYRSFFSLFEPEFDFVCFFCYKLCENFTSLIISWTKSVNFLSFFLKSHCIFCLRNRGTESNRILSMNRVLYRILTEIKSYSIRIEPNRNLWQPNSVETIFPENPFGSWESESCEVWVWDWKLACAYIHRLRYPLEISLLLPHHISILIGKFSGHAPGGGGANPMGNVEPNQYWLL